MSTTGDGDGQKKPKINADDRSKVLGNKLESANESVLTAEGQSSIVNNSVTDGGLVATAKNQSEISGNVVTNSRRPEPEPSNRRILYAALGTIGAVATALAWYFKSVSH